MAELRMPDSNADEPLEATQYVDTSNPAPATLRVMLEGKDKAYFEMSASLKGPAHAVDCSCPPCPVKAACIGARLAVMVSRDPTYPLQAPGSP